MWCSHEWVQGRGFIFLNQSIDLKWRACAKCGKWEVEGGLSQIYAELNPKSETNASIPQTR